MRASSPTATDVASAQAGRTCQRPPARSCRLWCNRSPNVSVVCWNGAARSSGTWERLADRRRRGGAAERSDRSPDHLPDRGRPEGRRRVDFAGADMGNDGRQALSGSLLHRAQAVDADFGLTFMPLQRVEPRCGGGLNCRQRAEFDVEVPHSSTREAGRLETPDINAELVAVLAPPAPPARRSRACRGIATDPSGRTEAGPRPRHRRGDPPSVRGSRAHCRCCRP